MLKFFFLKLNLKLFFIEDPLGNNNVLSTLMYFLLIYSFFIPLVIVIIFKTYSECKYLVNFINFFTILDSLFKS